MQIFFIISYFCILDKYNMWQEFLHVVKSSVCSPYLYRDVVLLRGG